MKTLSVFLCAVMLFAAGETGLYVFVTNYQNQARIPHALSSSELKYAPAADSVSSANSMASMSSSLISQLNADKNKQQQGKPRDFTHVKLLSDNRSATTSTYLNADGTKSVVYASQAVSYKDANGNWQSIDNTLVKDASGVWHTKANSWIAGFGDSATYGITITYSGSTFRELPQKANHVQPSVTKSGSVQLVTYKNLWNGVDLQYKVGGSEVKESIILHNSGVATDYSFAYSGSHLSPVADSPGTFALDGAFSGFKLAAPTVSTRTMLVPQGDSLVSQSADASTIRVSLDAHWLQKQPTSAFPIVIDPTVFVVPIGSAYNNFSQGGLNCAPGPSCGNLIGHDAQPGGDTWRSIYQVTIPSSSGQYLVSTLLHLEMPTGGGYGTTDPHTITINHASCTNGFSCVDPSYGTVADSIGTSKDIEVGSLYRAAVVASDTSPWMILQGEETSGDTFKYFDNTKTTVTFTYETLPTQSTIGTGAPLDNGIAVTTQPIIKSTVPTDPDGPGPFQYRYIIGTGKNLPQNDPFHIQQGVTGVLTDSGLLSLPQWVVPDNVLRDGTTYYWQPIVWDSYSGAPQVYGPVYSFKVDLRNGKDSTQTLDSFGPVNVDLATGNLTTSNGTNTIKALAGDIGVGLDYNSPQRSRSGLVGQYWNDPGDTRVFPGTAPVLTRVDPNVDFNWASSSPYSGVVSTDHFLVRWSGYFVAPQDGTYQFGTTSDDGSKVYVTDMNNAYLSSWTSNPTNLYGSGVALTAGQIVQIKYEYFEATGNALAQMLVKTTDGSITPRTMPTDWLQTGIRPVATPHGLIGHYYTDDGSHNFPVDANDPTRIFLTRTDTSMNLNWGTNAPVPGGPTDNFMVRWTGFFTAPLADTYTFGAGADDGVRIIINGNNTIVNAWSDHGASPIVYASSGVALTQGQTIPITIEYYEHTGSAQMALYAKQASLPSAPDTIVDSSWLSPSTQILPDGWNISLGTGYTVNYDYAVINQASVTLYDSQGQTHEYKFVNGGFTPPVNESGQMVRNGDGSVTLQDTGGLSYIFNSDGTIKSVTAASDDRNPAALQYVYGGSPVHLTQITDGVTNSRWIKILYSGDVSCPTPPSGFLSSAPANMICATSSSDGAMTKFFYNLDANGIPCLFRVEKPGAALTDYGYTAVGQINQVRDILANDAVAAGVRSQDGTELTQVSYDALGRVSGVTLPAATAGATRLAHTYAYLPNNVTLLHVTNATEPNGFTRKITYDGTFRTLTDTNIANLTSTTEWDSTKDLALSTTDPAGLKTTNLYDYDDRTTDTYGPAPSAWFGSDRKPLTSPTDYTPQVPHKQTGFDESIPGLASAYYNVTTASNGTGSNTKVLFGSPKGHATGIGPVNGDVVMTWNGTPPITPDTGDGWGARLTGDIHFTASGNYTFRIFSDDGVRLWIDDNLIIDDWTDGAQRSHPTGVFNNTNNPADSWHRVRLDYYNKVGDSDARLELYMTPPGGTETSSLGGLLTPLYGLVTSAKSFDSSASVGDSVVTNSYGTNPEFGLMQSSSVDPSGLNLTTNYTYEAPGTGSYLRQLSKTLPGGPATSFTYYGASETRQNPCNVSQTFNQAGMLKLTTEPDPDGAGAQTPITDENVYDDTGRIVADRLNSDSWRCTTYDSRGRITQIVIPAQPNTPNVTRSARTILYAWSVSGNPLSTYTGDPNTHESLQTNADLLGRPVTYYENKFINNQVITKSTNYAYDTIGRLITKTTGTAVQTYDYNTLNRLIDYKFNGTIYAVPTYDSFGRLQQVTYPNASQQKLTIGRDNLGRTTSRDFTLGNGTTHVIDTVTLSQSGQIVSGTENGAAKAYTYDKAGRLTNATLGTNTFAYSYAAPSPTTCNQSSANLNAQKDGNRTSQTVNGTTTTYCYNKADRLIASSDSNFTAPTYDAHGNLYTSNPFTDIEYDSSDRNVYISDTGGTVNITRDVVDRIFAASSSYYGYTNRDSSSPEYRYSSTGTIAEYYLQLPGDVEMTINSAGSTKTYSLTDLRGDVFETTNGSGATPKAYQYEPYGSVIGAFSPGNITGFDSFSSLGQYGKITYSTLNTRAVQLGARLYLPTLGRFAQVDPVEGGNVNAYAYPQDPVNSKDLTGKCLGPVFLLCLYAVAEVATVALTGIADYYAFGGGGLQGGEAIGLQGLTKAERIALNAKRGKAAEEQVANGLAQRYGAENVVLHGKGLSYDIPNLGRRYPDITVFTPEARAGRFLVEVKSGNAVYSATQKAKDAYIEQLFGVKTQLTRVK